MSTTQAITPSSSHSSLKWTQVKDVPPLLRLERIQLLSLTIRRQYRQYHLNFVDIRDSDARGNHQSLRHRLSLVRSTHPVLRHFNTVDYHYGQNFWLVHLKSATREIKGIPLHIGKRPVYLAHGEIELHRSRSDFVEDIDPAALLSNEQVDTIRKHFRYAYGVRILRWGFVDVLFRTEEDLVLQKKIPMPASVGSLPFACIVTAHRPTAGQLAGDNVPTSSTAGQLAGDNVPSSSMVPSTILPSTQVTGRTEADFMAPSCIGVRIRLRGQTFLTATSHGFVHLDRLGLSNDVSVPQEKQELEAILYPPMEPSPSRLARLRTFIAHRLLRQRPQKTETPVQRPKTSTVNKILSPVGVTVYAEGSGLVLGRVVKTYDQLPAQTAHYLNLFPFGFPHNLSLIAAIDEQHPLPKMVIPTWYPMIGPRFANPQSALHQESFAHPPIISMWDRIIGKVPPPPSTPAFLWQHNSLLRKRRQWRLGRVACEATKAVLICGADYLFEAEHVQRSLIWRTERDDLSLAGSSGSVLCLGRPEDSQAQAIVFQNFETPISPKQLKTTRETYAGIPEGFTYKGGFFLPSEILNESIIEMTQATDIATSHSYNSDKDWTKLKSMPTSRSALLNYFRARKSCKEL